MENSTIVEFWGKLTLEGILVISSILGHFDIFWKNEINKKIELIN